MLESVAIKNFRGSNLGAKVTRKDGNRKSIV